MNIHQRILNFIPGWGYGGGREDEWEKLAREVRGFQLRRNPAFRRWHEQNPSVFLPIFAFKETRIASFSSSGKKLYFESSGTTAGGERKSRHFFKSPDLYKTSVIEGWKWNMRMRSSGCGARSAECRFRKGRGDFEFHPPSAPVGSRPCRRSGLRTPHSPLFPFLALMPSFREKPHSSLSCMLDILMEEFGAGDGFWAMKKGRWDWQGLAMRLKNLEKEKRTVVLFGTAFAWVYFLDWCKAHGKSFHLSSDSLVFETGGVKGRSREIPQMELHRELGRLLGLPPRSIASEYSMCELSSQAWSIPSKSKIIFRFPPWCRFRVVLPKGSREAAEGGKGVLEVLDLANLDSCAFIRTEDLAIRRGSGFEWVGRLPRAGLKGCSLEYEN